MSPVAEEDRVRPAVEDLHPERGHSGPVLDWKVGRRDGVDGNAIGTLDPVIETELAPHRRSPPRVVASRPAGRRASQQRQRQLRPSLRFFEDHWFLSGPVLV